MQWTSKGQFSPNFVQHEKNVNWHKNDFQTYQWELNNEWVWKLCAICQICLPFTKNCATNLNSSFLQCQSHMLMKLALKSINLSNLRRKCDLKLSQKKIDILKKTNSRENDLKKVFLWRHLLFCKSWWLSRKKSVKEKNWSRVP